MSPAARPVRLIFPHQLFADHLTADKATVMVLVEDDLFFTQYAFHKQKLVLHRAAMRHFADGLKAHGYQMEVIETAANHSSQHRLKELLAKLQPSEIAYYDLVDDWLQQAVDKLVKPLRIPVHRLLSPGFLTSPGQIDDYFSHNPNRMEHFYQWQRRRLGILLDGTKPVGGKWSYDSANRQKLPKQIRLPAPYPSLTSQHVAAALAWVEETFADNPGETEAFRYPVTHQHADAWLERFVSERLPTFGPYEDAIDQQAGELFHSVLSPLLNIGLLTPQQVINAVMDYASDHDVAIESLEGFIRQVIGWREYMRAMYVRSGRRMRISNHLQAKRSLAPGWWDGTTGIEPIDTVIKRVLQTAYAHHIERLMVLGNSMVLLRSEPDEVYEWFMTMFIDAYDWVMVPNVYAMSQFAAGEMVTTKPYISGSNYILKMSDYPKAEWCNIWDALYWQFIDDHREVIERNFRSRMVVKLYDRFDADKKHRIKQLADTWLA